MYTQEDSNPSGSIRKAMLKKILLISAPLIAAGLFILLVSIQALFRYDESYFTPEYQDAYISPGTVARDLETALRAGDSELYAGLTGLRSSPDASEQKPNIILTILLDVDERDYFHYLFFDMGTMKRETHYIKQVNNRWIVSPEDTFFYLDSGRWISSFGPIAAIWWTILLTIAIGKLFSHLGSRTRAAMGM